MGNGRGTNYFNGSNCGYFVFKGWQDNEMATDKKGKITITGM